MKNNILIFIATLLLLITVIESISQADSRDIVGMLKVKPKIRERKPIVERVTHKVLEFVEVFIGGMGV